MSPIVSIWQKDFLLLLKKPFFYILLGLCCLIWGLFFTFDVFRFVSQSFQLESKAGAGDLNIHRDLVSNYLVIVHYVMVFVIAALSVRFFSEEKKSKTFSLLMTSPLSSWQIVFGKAAAGCSQILAMLLVSAVFPISLSYFASLPWTLLIFGYWGLFLTLNIYLGLALIASSLSESLLICMVLSLVMSMAVLLIGLFGQLTTWPFLQSFFQYMTIDLHFGHFRSGQFSWASHVFLISGFCFFLRITERIIESERWQ